MTSSPLTTALTKRKAIWKLRYLGGAVLFFSFPGLYMMLYGWPEGVKI